MTVRQVPEDQRKRSRGGGRKFTSIPLKEQLFITLARLRRGLDEELLADLNLTSQLIISRLLATWINFLYLHLGSLPHGHLLSKCVSVFLKHSRAVTVIRSYHRLPGATL